MSRKVLYTCRNGLGDKLLDVVGSYTFLTYMNYIPAIFLNPDAHKFEWGPSAYDERLFDFQDFELIHYGNSDNYIRGQTKLYIEQHGQSSIILSPVKSYELLRTYYPDITFEEVSRKFAENAKKIIQPASWLTSRYPAGLENAYGLHLRKSDKIKKDCDKDWSKWGETDLDEFFVTMRKVIEYVEGIIKTESNPSFFIVSEDKAWKNEITNVIKNIGIENLNEVKFIDVDYGEDRDKLNAAYINYESVLDMFCLSKCKTIIQGVKYSAFSIIAAILGNNKLVNFSEYTNNHDKCYIHLWESILEINNVPMNYDHKDYEFVSAFINRPETNITSVWEE